MAKMKVLLIFISFFGFQLSFGSSSKVGTSVHLPAGTVLKKSTGRGGVRVQSGGAITLGQPTRSFLGGLNFPVNIGGSTYYLNEKTAISLGYVSPEECSSLRKNASARNQSDIGKVAQSAGNVGIGLQHLPSPNKGWAPNCSNFINSAGGIGPWGQAFLNEAAKIPAPGGSALAVMMSPQLWHKMCPGFVFFSPERKQHFIASFIATKAMDESSCDPNARNWITPNPPGVGFFQLEGQGSLRAFRGPACSGGYKSGIQTSLTLQNQFSCAASQIVSTQWLRGRPFCTPGGYWQEANSPSGDICQSMSRYPGCRGR